MKESNVTARFTVNAENKVRFQIEIKGQDDTQGLKWDIQRKQYWLRGARGPLPKILDHELRGVCEDAVSEWAWGNMQAATRQITSTGRSEWREIILSTLTTWRTMQQAINHGGLDHLYTLDLTEAEREAVALRERIYNWADRRYLRDVCAFWGVHLEEGGHGLLRDIQALLVEDNDSAWHEVARWYLERGERAEDVLEGRLEDEYEKHLQRQRTVGRMTVNNQGGRIPKESSPRSDEHNFKSSARKI